MERVIRIFRDEKLNLFIIIDAKLFMFQDDYFCSVDGSYIEWNVFPVSFDDLSNRIKSLILQVYYNINHNANKVKKVYHF